MLLNVLRTAIQDADGYVLRWPAWVGGVIALLLGSAFVALLVGLIRLMVGRKIVWIVVAAVALALGTFLVIEVQRSETARGDPLAFASTLVALMALVVGPAYGVDIGARRPDTTLGRQVVMGMLLGVASCTIGVLGILLSAWVIRALT